MAGGNSETWDHWRKNSLSVQYPETTSVMKTTCRVPGQIEAQEFPRWWGPGALGNAPTLLSATQSK